MQAPLLSAALQAPSKQAICHCSYLWRFALYTAGSGLAQMHCSIVQGKMQSPTVAALQNSLTAGNVSLQLHLWRFAQAQARRPSEFGETVLRDFVLSDACLVADHSISQRVRFIGSHI